MQKIKSTQNASCKKTDYSNRKGMTGKDLSPNKLKKLIFIKLIKT